jgi:type VI secretion system protein ImpA
MGNTIQEAEPPNWREIKQNSEQLLTRTLDLRILISYLRALIATQGFSGLADGLTLIQALVEQRWDSIHPQLDPDDDNDPTERINILMTLCDNDAVLRPLSQLPFLESKLVGRFNFREVSLATGKATPTATEKVIEQSNIDAAVQDSEAGDLIQLLSDLTVSLTALDALEKFLTEQVGISNAPSFAGLRTFLKESKTFVLDWHERKGIGSGTEETPLAEEAPVDVTNAETAPVTSVSPKPALSTITNSQDVIKALNLICDYYQKYEPSSPVPIFLERAKRLVGKNFIEVLEDIAPQGVEQALIFKGNQNQS